ncbi:1183_t:CDS:2 [Paraglomus occultum]|uniref:1183_t:CDS:1 n=1 Tax=Paraglomus occultum TaxID=144539 RepID=A0A9N9AWW6_9GLOM|nr:1183_t:CDS:2 [Paraglomus occultum]
MDEDELAKKARIEAEAEDTNSNEILVVRINLDNSTEGIIKKDTEKLIDFLREQNLFLNNKHLEILREREIAGCDFLKMDNQDFRECGLEIRPAMRRAGFAKKLNDQSEDSSNEFKNSTVEIPPTVAELDMKLLSDNVNKIIRGEFQNIRGI